MPSSYYGFGPDKTINEITSNEILLILQSVGFDKVSIVNNKLVKQNQFTKLDFNAIAKGYTVDCIYQYLASLGSKNFLIEIGGEIRAKGINPISEKKRKIGIRLPQKGNENKFIQIRNIDDYAIATSGNYNKFSIGRNCWAGS